MENKVPIRRTIKIALLTVLLLFLFACTPKEQILDEAEYKGISVTILGTGGAFGHALVLSDETGENRIEMPDMQPWQVDFCNIDGDTVELALGVYKESPQHPVKAKRIFFYNLDGLRLVPKYRMSRLSYPFVAYRLRDIDGDGRDEILAIERMQDDSYALGGYRWTHFGFERVYVGDGRVDEDFFTPGRLEQLYLNENRIQWEAEK